MTIRQLFTLLAGLLIPALAFATHNRAGEIHIRQIGPLTIEATIITWTKASSVNADRDTLIICWGDGSPCQNVPRSNGGGEGIFYPGDLKYNTYVAVHTFAGPSTYRISMTDPNRIAPMNTWLLFRPQAKKTSRGRFGAIPSVLFQKSLL